MQPCDKVKMENHLISLVGQNSDSRWLRRKIHFFIFFHLILPALIWALGFLFVCMNLFVRESGLEIGLIILMLIPGAFLVYPLMKFLAEALREIHHFQHSVRKRVFLKIADANIVASIANAVDILKLEMNINNKINFWLSPRNTGCLPSIVMTGRVANLVLPLGFIYLSGKYAEQAKAILAHEFAHIKQDDTKLWHAPHVLSESLCEYLERRIRGFVWAGAFSVFCYTVIDAISGYAFDDLFKRAAFQAIPWVISGLFLYYSYYSLKSLREAIYSGLRKSEKLADVRAVCYSQEGSFIAALNNYALDCKSYENPFHLPKPERLSFIQQLESARGALNASRTEAVLTK